MSEDERLLARLLDKQVDNAADKIGERPTISSSVSGSGAPKRKMDTHLQKPEGPTSVEFENPFCRYPLLVYP